MPWKHLTDGAWYSCEASFRTCISSSEPSSLHVEIKCRLPTEAISLAIQERQYMTQHCESPMQPSSKKNVPTRESQELGTTIERYTSIACNSPAKTSNHKAQLHVDVPTSPAIPRT
eukprot:CAMPEP_0204163910 /NCGR_PEP_ID=MMETSP0361-20130328/36805_1 /ASSEMBLY_ACC=CAM_ASM_000343 /TAXON_ID=268821 /ORGANISM="Scrippsiella Hangoei, Strain SHTV-5" /LENGTH=115 /DNA_ID=CAMNT_0051120683 /DNA_START=217 /DNA_END=564 /DNA_ORIENTATION=+